MMDLLSCCSRVPPRDWGGIDVGSWGPFAQTPEGRREIGMLEHPDRTLMGRANEDAGDDARIIAGGGRRVEPRQAAGLPDPQRVAKIAIAPLCPGAGAAGMAAMRPGFEGREVRPPVGSLEVSRDGGIPPHRAAIGARQAQERAIPAGGGPEMGQRSVRLGPIGPVIVRVDGGSPCGMTLDKRDQVNGTGGLHNLRPHLPAVPVLHTDNGGHVNRPAPGGGLALGIGPVGSDAAHIGLVNLIRSTHRWLIIVPPEHLADAPEHEPRRLLGHANVPMQFHGTDTLEAGHVQIDGQHPLAQWQG